MEEKNEKRTDVDESTLSALKKEVHLLYFLEKDMSQVKKEMDEMKVLKKDIEKQREEREKMKETLKKIRTGATVVILTAIFVGAVFTFVSCDGFFNFNPDQTDFDKITEDMPPELINPTEEESTNVNPLYSKTFTASSSSAPYSTIAIDGSGNVSALSAANRTNYRGTVEESAIVINNIRYTYDLKADGTLTITNSSASYSYKLS